MHSILTPLQSPQMSGQPRTKVSQHPQTLAPLKEVSESQTSTMSHPPKHPPLGPPPNFPPASPPQNHMNGAMPLPPLPPPGIGGAGPPPPPPPPPVAAPIVQVSLSEMINKHKLKTAQEGKNCQKKQYSYMY